MKKLIQSNSFKTFVLAITLMEATSCTNNQKPKDTKDVAEEHNEAKFNNKAQEKDSQFLVSAAEISLEEIQLGQLAQRNSNMSDVKKLGMMMEKEHVKSLTDLSTLAGKKMITIPTSLTDDAKNTYNKLDKKSGTDFDDDYCEIMVKGHKDAITLFEKASKESSDTDIREWASATLPDLRSHLDYAITCQKKSKK